MESDYAILYNEEKNKTSKFIDIVSTVNQSISTLTIIVTFFSGICFYFCRVLFQHFNFDSFLFIASSVIWIISCLLNVILLNILVLNLFNNKYYLPLLGNNYVEKILKFIQGNDDEKNDKIYENLFLGYVEINKEINTARKKRIKYFNNVQKIFMVSLILFSLSVILFGIYVVNQKARTVLKEKNDIVVIHEGTVYYNGNVKYIFEREKSTKKGDYEMCDDEKTPKQDDPNILPDIRVEIRPITATRNDKEDVKKIIIENKVAEE